VRIGAGGIFDLALSPAGLSIGVGVFGDPISEAAPGIGAVVVPFEEAASGGGVTFGLSGSAALGKAVPGGAAADISVEISGDADVGASMIRTPRDSSGL
jgi:hypothetical protein